MIVELAGSLDRALAFMRAQVEDLSDPEMVVQPLGVPHHAAWTLGHVIHGCQAIAMELGACPWLADDWESLFGYGSSPDNVTASARWSRDALLAALAEAGDRLRAVLLATDERRLSEPLPDEQVCTILPTLGDALIQVLCAHTAYHAGQLATWRRAIGRAPAGMFI